MKTQESLNGTIYRTFILDLTHVSHDNLLGVAFHINSVCVHTKERKQNKKIKI